MRETRTSGATRAEGFRILTTPPLLYRNPRFQRPVP
jgi:hypothetical protein